jgi:class 3 adenylate cyclase/TolB-like protein
MERRLAAILMTDVVGYTRLMGSDEEGTFLALKKRRVQLLEPSVASHAGRVVKLTGDGALIEFSSAVEALSCAAEIQSANERANAAVAPDKQIRLRMGINVGDLIFDEGDVFGTGVNVAARLQTIAEPGGICISGTAVEHAGVAADDLHYLGWQALKNLDHPIEVYAFRPIQGKGASRQPRRSRSASASRALRLPKVPGDRPSIAVLPFESIGTDEGQRYFSDGITRDVTTELSRFRSLSVIASNSSFRFRDAAQNRGEIGLALGARYIVDGNVQRIGEEIRVTARLIDAELGIQMWAQRYNHAVADPTMIQDRLAHDLAANLNIHLEASELSRSKRKPSAGLLGYDLWLQGAEEHERGGDDGYARARKLYERAIAADPGFARPYARLAELSYMESVLANWGVEKDDSAEAWDLASRALRLDPEDANGHAIIAWIHMVRHEFAKAERHWSLAADLNSNDADIMMWRATALAFLGDPPAGEQLAREAMRLNPLHPQWYVSDLAVALFFCGRFEEMLASYELIPELYPHTPAWRAAAYAHLGLRQEASDRARQFCENIRPIWSGAADAGPRDYGRWFRHCIPLRRGTEIALMEDGLRGAGLL